ncbi:MAG: sugar kinase, partial [Clostridia bacterium]|nr:sugar kinase [Clostridia bacterium]
FIFHIGNTPAVLASTPAAEKLAGAKYFHIMGCSMMANLDFGRRIVEAMKSANDQGAKVSFDPNIRPELMKDPEAMDLVAAVMERMNVYMPGVGELLQFSGKDSIEEAVAHYFENPNLELIVLKDGSRGCHIYGKSGKVFSFGVYKAKPVDATGAGDSFDAAFLCGLIEGKSIEDATKMATAAATLNIAAFGPMEGKINRENMEALIKENNIQ